MRLGNSTKPLAAIAALCAATIAIPLTTPAAAQSGLEWSFAETTDAGNDRRLTARLKSTVAATERVELVGTCRSWPKSDTDTADLIVALEVGDQKTGEAVKVRFSGGGRETTIDGDVAGTDTADGITGGAVVRPAHDAELWEMLTTLDTVNIAVPGYVGTTLDLASGRERIKLFRIACRTYAEAEEEPETANERETTSTSAYDPIEPAKEAIEDAKTERGAFAEAKSRQTIDAWNEFLKRFPDGFRADLARAYVRRLEAALVEVAAGDTEWSVDQEALASDDGRIVDVALVRADGANLAAYCRPGARPSIALSVRPQDGNKEVADALAAAVRDARPLSPSNVGIKRIDVRFSDGARLSSASTYDTVADGQGLRILSGGEPLDAMGAGVGRLLSERSIKVEAGSFKAEFQLDGSRAAICTVLSACGVARPDCEGVAPPPGEPVTTSALSSERDDVEEADTAPAKTIKKSTPKAKVGRDTANCTGGRYYNKRRGSCACPSSRPHWNGRRCYGKVAKKSPSRAKRHQAKRHQKRNCRIDFNRNTMYDKKGSQQLITICD